MASRQRIDLWAQCFVSETSCERIVLSANWFVSQASSQKVTLPIFYLWNCCWESCPTPFLSRSSLAIAISYILMFTSFFLPVMLLVPCCIVRNADLPMRKMSVRLSVCQMLKSWQNKRNVCPHFYNIWKNDHPSFPIRRMVVVVHCSFAISLCVILSPFIVTVQFLCLNLIP